jgi:ABC-type Fe3+-siderophore transport system permease subunit
MQLAILLHEAPNYTTGISVGSAVFSSIAVVCSWTRNKSLLWAFIAGVFSIFYIIYWNLTRTEEEQKNN